MSDEFDWYDEYLFRVHTTIEEHGFFIQTLRRLQPVLDFEVGRAA
jgi:hypothetical protein